MYIGGECVHKPTGQQVCVYTHTVVFLRGAAAASGKENVRSN
jgi:hypothetical protein